MEKKEFPSIVIKDDKIEFTVARQLKTNIAPTAPTPRFNWHQFRKLYQDVVSKRMELRAAMLESALADGRAIKANDSVVLYGETGGHFSVTAYKAMHKFVSEPTIQSEDMSPLMWNQIVKAMFTFQSMMENSVEPDFWAIAFDQAVNRFSDSLIEYCK